jgi:DNA invertase Pin-like site-specific DNA recombinase
MNTKPTTSSSRLVGYARVSTGQQDLQLQLDALKVAGVSKANLYTDKISGSKAARPGLDQCLSVVEDLRQRGVGFKSLRDGAIDTTTASGKLIFHIFTALAEFERSLIQERTNAGLKAARVRGRLGGRPPMSLDEPRIQTAKKLHADRSMVVADICKTLQISRPTLYRWVSV